MNERRLSNLKRLIAKFGSQANLAKSYEGLDASYICTLLKGRRTFGERAARNMERKCNLPEHWFDVEHNDEKLDNNIEPAFTHSSYVPLVSWVQAGNWESPMDDRDKYDMVHCPIKQHSEKTFALTVRGISMYDPSDPKSFEEGDTIFVDPCREAISGSMVIAMHDGSYEATFKQLVVEDGKMYLHALNPNWQPNLQELTQDTYICGVVIARIKTTTYV